MVYQSLTGIFGQFRRITNTNVVCVTGYAREYFESRFTNTVHNSEYSETNMVWSLSRALPLIKALPSDEIYITYGDIIVHNEHIRQLVKNPKDFVILSDENWQTLWKIRDDDYMNDVETFKHKNGKVLELGGRPKSSVEIQGQYIGMFKVRKALLSKLLDQYLAKAKKLQKKAYELKTHKNMYMTDFIQDYINDGGYVAAEFIEGGWLEVDTVADIDRYSQNCNHPVFKGLIS